MLIVLNNFPDSSWELPGNIPLSVVTSANADEILSVEVVLMLPV
jgi:hypothetical protein